MGFGGQAQRRFSHQLEAGMRRCHELGALGAVGDVLARRVHALLRVGVKQRRLRTLPQNEREFPCQVGCIVESGVQAPHAEDRHQMRGVAGEQNASVAIVVEREAFCVVDRDPQWLPRRRLTNHPEMALHARQHVRRLDRLDGILVVRNLIVDAPDVVRLSVHQNRGTSIGRRIEPCQPLDCALGVLLDVDDDVPALVLHAVELEAELFAHRAASAVAGDHPIGRDRSARAVGACTCTRAPLLDVSTPITLLDQRTSTDGVGTWAARWTNSST